MKSKKALSLVLPLCLVVALLFTFAVTGTAADKPDNGVNLTVGDNIVSHYYIDTAYYKAQGCDALQYTYNGTSNQQDYTSVTSPMISLAETDAKYEITATQAAAQIAEPTVIHVYKGGAVFDTVSYSTKTYCDNIIAMNDETLLEYTGRPIKLNTLCKSIIAYAKAAQALFPDYMSKPGAVAITDDYSDDLGLSTVSYTPNIQLTQGTNVRFTKASFICSSSAGMRFYFNASGSYGDPIVSGPNDISWSKGNAYIQINGIKPVFFDEAITVTYGDASISMNVLDYAGIVLGNSASAETQQALAKALLAHNESADAYFETHTLELVPAVAATCTEAGNKAYYRCTECGQLCADEDGEVEITLADTVVAALGHNYNAQVTAPTCTEQGFTTYTCTRCGDTYKADYTDAKGHTSVTDAAVAATCTTTGLSEGSHCSVCNTVLTAQEEVPALGHSYGDWAVTTDAVAATCTATGKTAIETKTCSRCGDQQTRGGETVAALGHSESSTWTVKTGATLSAAGTEVKTCTRCGVEMNTRTVQNFTLKLPHTADYLYRIGNANNVTLGTLFDNASGAAVSNVSASVTKNTGNAAATFTANASDWRNSTLKFTGTGVVTVTLKHGTGTVTTLKLEVVTATNATAATAVTSSKNVVLLKDVAITGSLSVAGGTLYGNGFTIDATGTASSEGVTKLASINGAINLTGGTLNNVKVVGPVLSNAAVYSTKDSNFVYTVKTSGACYIYNSYLSGSRSVIGTYGDASTSSLTIENSVIDGGRFSNIFVRFGSLNLHNVTTISQPRLTMDGKMRCGYGIVFSDEAGAECQLTATGYLKQYNWVGKNKDVSYFAGDNSNSDSNSVMTNLFSNMYSKASALTVSYDNDTFINTGILSQNATVPKATGSAVSGFGLANITLLGNTGWVMTNTSLDASADLQYYSETTYAPSEQVPTVPTFTWNYPTTYSSTEKQVNLTFESGNSVTMNPNILSASKYNNNLTVSASMNGATLGNTVSFDQAGDYTITYTVTDPYNYAADGVTTTTKTYTKTLKVHVTETISTIKEPEFTFYGTDGSTSLGTTKIVDIGGKHYITLEGTPSGAKSTTVSGTTIYYPEVTVRFKDNSSDFNYKFPIFYGVNIKNYTDVAGNSTTYNKSTSSMPDAVTRVSADPNWNGKSSFKSTSKDSTYGLCYFSDAIGSNQSARNATIQFKLTAGNGEEYYYYVYYNAAAHNKPSCVAEGSLVTMADGSKKSVEQIKRGDLVMTWSFWNGQYEAMPVGVVWYHGTMNWDVLTLKFSDNTQVRMITEHGFFDVDKNTYAYITAKNVDNYIGDRFVKQAADGSNQEVTLVSYTVTNENVGCYSLQTVKNDNFLVEDMISITAEEEYPGKFEFFEVGEGMQYDAAKMQADIEKYGLYTYDEWADLLSEEEFYALNGPYYKVLVGKGVLTKEDIISIIEINLKQNPAQ